MIKSNLFHLQEAEARKQEIMNKKKSLKKGKKKKKMHLSTEVAAES